MNMLLETPKKGKPYAKDSVSANVSPKEASPATASLAKVSPKVMEFSDSSNGSAENHTLNVTFTITVNVPKNETPIDGSMIQPKSSNIAVTKPAIDYMKSGNKSTKRVADEHTLKVPKIVVSAHAKPRISPKMIKLQPLALNSKPFGINTAFSSSQLNPPKIAMVNALQKTPKNSPLKALPNGNEKLPSTFNGKQLAKAANALIVKENEENIPTEAVSNGKVPMANERYPKSLYISPFIFGRRPIRRAAPAVKAPIAKQRQSNVNV